MVILCSFIAKITVIVREKTEEIRWVICYDIYGSCISFIEPKNGENNYEYSSICIPWWK
ncbi:hypothetical protein JCM18507_27040 [Fusicatenibacter saccharivorans]